ncbi:MAG TPA: biotin/lipoyl-containing protein [Anaerolineae bacterium]
MKYATTIGDQTYIIEINREGEIIIDGETCRADLRSIDGLGTFSLLLDNESHEALVEARGDKIGVLLRGRFYPVRVEDERARRLAESSRGLGVTSGEVVIKSPMPGLIVSVHITPGQDVKKGQTLVILESMKMENELKAPRDGKIGSVRVEARQTVEQGQTLVTID